MIIGNLQEDADSSNHEVIITMKSVRIVDKYTLQQYQQQE